MSARLAPLLRQAAHRHAHRTRAAESADPADLRLSVSELLKLHGDASTAVVLMVLSTVIVVPVVGVGTVLSLGLMALSWSWIRGHETVSLPQRLGNVTLNERWTGRCLHGLAWIYEQSNRWTRPRWAAWSHERTRVWWGAWIGLMAGVIFLPLPLGNVLPSLSLILLSLGWMARDGLVLLLSSLVGVAALLYLASLWHLATEVVMRAWNWLPL